MGKWKSTKNHWTKKLGEERKKIMEKVSRGWNGRPKNRVKCKCIVCGTEFEIKKSRIKSGRGKYCLRICKDRDITRINSGDKHWNWQGGITTESEKIRKSIEYRLWRESVFARDNYTCQKTGKKGGNLIAHHIKNFADYPELRFAIDNGITFSEKAHDEFHKIYGKKNNNEKQIKEFLT